ncbi:MAG: hypothetical protein QNJ45_08625 [Ardenticatenaceae bacterium]|nr:hypothetical protein [Ardenticatenaceae bacterium]
MSNKPLQFSRFYHIYNRGNNGENLFVQQRNYPYFINLYTKYIVPVAQTFAYSLLPNHFHFFIRTRSEEEQLEQIGPFSENGPISITQPSRAFNNMFIAYARAFNNATGRTGALFERPFHRKPVESNAHAQNLITYIHRNAETHGLVDDFRDWPWSSYEAYLSSAPTKIERDEVLEWFGGVEQFVAAHKKIETESLVWFDPE